MRFSGTEFEQLATLVKTHVKPLLDFPLTIPDIEPLVVKGNITFLTDQPVTHRDLTSCDLRLSYQGKSSATNPPIAKSITYSWTDFSTTEIPDRTVDFDFKQADGFVVNRASLASVSLQVKSFDGSVLWQHSYPADDTKLTQVHIELPLVKATVLSADAPTDRPVANRPLKGQIVEATGKCSLNNVTVILQAKAKKEDPVWKVVGVATTDVTGSFTMPYPVGTYEVAQALVSLAPDSPVDVGTLPPGTQQNPMNTIVQDFLYILVENAVCNDEEQLDEDCDCHATTGKTPRLPDQKDLIGSDKFSQDLGGGTCLNLTTPNRTLHEQTYFAIVRTSDPDVANYVLQKQTASPEADGFQRVTFSLGTGTKIERTEISFENAIRWQDAPDTTDKDNHLSFYQAVSVAHGHLLHYKSVLKADGYSLGDLLYSLPLAPGQKKQIVVYDWKRSLQGSETQQLTQREGLTASLVNDRTILDNLSGGINELLQGQSSASTSGISAGLGIGAIVGPVGGVLGVSGGTSSSSSSASQQSYRNTVQAFGETLRNAIMQSASAYRELNGTLIDTVTEGQQFATTTEVVANHNHCHSLTMLYFEVLRHYAVFQELVQVEECIFVPLIMTNFSMENIHKWRDVLAANLLYRPSNTHLSLFMNRNPLVKAFDANERVKTNWANVDFPTSRYCDEAITSLTGYITLNVNIPRPKTYFDRILAFPIVKKETITDNHGGILGSFADVLVGEDKTKTTTLERVKFANEHIIIYDNFQSARPADVIEVINFDGIILSGSTEEKQWIEIAKLCGMPDLTSFLSNYFSHKTISQWDEVFNREIAPKVFEMLTDNRISIAPFGPLDFTATSKYYGGNQLIRLNLIGNTSLVRASINSIRFFFANPILFQDSFWALATLNLENVSINYTTQHYSGILINRYLKDDLKDGTPDIPTPLNSDEQRNPRKEDKFIVNELITHLNSNLEYYNKVLWRNLDPDRRYLLLDGFHIQVYDDLNQPSSFRSLASIVKNQLIGIAGNSLIFPVAAGVKVDRSYIIVTSHDEQGQAIDRSISLFDHYRPLTPPDPYRISVPTRGVFAEAVQGACDACEKVKDNTSQDWDKFKTDEPTPIGTVTVPTPTPTDWKAAFKDFATPIVNIQNAPTAPAPGAGLAGLSDLLGKSDVFKDITGLDANQKNALATYLSNQENAKAFASMAKDMAMQAHNTENSDKIKNAINEAQSSGAISKEDANKLTKDHLQQMIDGGESKKAEASQASASKPSLTDAAVKAADQGKSVKAQSTDTTTGKTESVEIAPKDEKLKYNFVVPGIFTPIKQSTPNACWATVTTMMANWKNGQSQSVNDYISSIGAEYLPFINTGITIEKLGDFCAAAGLKMASANTEYPVSFYVDILQKNGPIWVIDLESADPKMLHGRLLIGIKGDDSSDSTMLTIIDPATGSKYDEDLPTFLAKTENVVKTIDAIKDVEIPLLIYYNNSYGPSAGTSPSGAGGAIGSPGQPSFSLTSENVTKLIQYEFKNASEINDFFKEGAINDFIDWFNTNHAKKGPFAGKQINGNYPFDPAKNMTLAEVKQNFISFWDFAPVIFGKPTINLIEFITLMTSPINELNGNMTGRWPEGGSTLSWFFAEQFLMKNGTFVLDKNGNKIRVKNSYNTAPNKNAQICFNDSDYKSSHSTNTDGSSKPYATQLAGVAGAAWNDTRKYPQGFSDDPAPDKSGYIREADFYKFRGRGVIQITWRDAYRPLVDFVLNYPATGNSAVIKACKTKWETLFATDTNAKRLDRICMISTNEDWDTLFADYEFLANSVRIFSTQKGGFLELGNTANALNGTGKKSIQNVGTQIGWPQYGSDIFRPRAMTLLNAIAAKL